MQFEDPSEGVAARLEAGTAPVAGLEGLMNDPAKMQAILAMLKHDAEERERTGETVEQQMLREKMEWAAADARSAEIKLEANEAFRKGDYKEAFVLYSLCCQQSGHEPLYPLNRAAAGLSTSIKKVFDKSRILLGTSQNSTCIVKLFVMLATRLKGISTSQKPFTGERKRTDSLAILIPLKPISHRLFSSKKTTLLL